MSIMDWAKENAKDGSNFAELEEMVERANPLNGVKTKDEAFAFIIGNDILKSTLDLQVTKAIQGHDEKFNENKLPKILEEERAKIRAELNPEETEDQKEIRRLREDLNTQKSEAQRERLKLQLISSAKERGFSDEIASQFVVFGDDAPDRLNAVADYVDKLVGEKVEAGVKEKFKGRGAPDAPRAPGKGEMMRGDFNALSAAEQMEFARKGGRVVD